MMYCMVNLTSVGTIGCDIVSLLLEEPYGINIYNIYIYSSETDHDLVVTPVCRSS
jgi:hypothetical protein